MKKVLFLHLFIALISLSAITGFTNVAVAQCTGMPNSGAAIGNPTTHTCSGTSNLNLGGATMGMGMTYQWEYSTDGVNWFPLGSPQPVPPTTTGTITQTTMYRVISTCTNSGMFAVSTPVTITVNPGQQVIPTATITPSTGTTACVDDAITFTSTITNGGSTPTYQWQVNGSNVGTNSSTYIAPAGSLVTNDNVSLTVTSSEPCAVPQTALASVTMTILPLVAPTVSIQADQVDICETEVVTFTATDNAPGGTYQWYVNGNPSGPNSNTYTFAPTMGDVISLDFTPPAAGCYDNVTVTSNSIAMNVTPGQPTLATIASIPAAVEGTYVTVYANLFNFSLNYTIDWYINTVFYTTTTVPYMSYLKGPGTDAIFAVANNSGTGCYVTDTTDEIFITSIPTSVASVNGTGNISIFPNPATNSMKVTGLADGDQLQLLNLLGQPVISRQIITANAEETMDLSGLPAGNYLLNIRASDGSLKEIIHIVKN